MVKAFNMKVEAKTGKMKNQWRTKQEAKENVINKTTISSSREEKLLYP